MSSALPSVARPLAAPHQPPARMVPHTTESPPKAQAHSIVFDGSLIENSDPQHASSSPSSPSQNNGFAPPSKPNSYSTPQSQSGGLGASRKVVAGTTQFAGKPVPVGSGLLGKTSPSHSRPALHAGAASAGKSPAPPSSSLSSPVPHRASPGGKGASPSVSSPFSSPSSPIPLEATYVPLPPLPPRASVLASRLSYIGPSSESNWVIPGHLLVGAYPAVVDDRENLNLLWSFLSCSVTTFVCLQVEYPGADCPEEKWRRGEAIRPYYEDLKKIVLHLNNLRREEGIQWEEIDGEASDNATGAEAASDFPKRWIKARSAAIRPASSIPVPEPAPGQQLPLHPSVTTPGLLAFVHCPIVDCSVTDDDTMLALALDLLRRMHSGEVLYVHCWGGHGRTGTVVSCMLAIEYGFKTGDEAMSWCQFFHDLRRVPIDVGSPQTQQQRDQVNRVVAAYYAMKEQEAAAVAAAAAATASPMDVDGGEPSDLGASRFSNSSPVAPRQPQQFSHQSLPSGSQQHGGRPRGASDNNIPLMSISNGLNGMATGAPPVTAAATTDAATSGGARRSLQQAREDARDKRRANSSGAVGGGVAMAQQQQGHNQSSLILEVSGTAPAHHAHKKEDELSMAVGVASSSPLQPAPPKDANSSGRKGGRFVPGRQ